MDTLILLKSDRFVFKYPYQINRKGEIYSSISGRWLKSFYDRDGYLRISLAVMEGKRKSIPLHRLLMNTFKPHEDSLNLTVNHIDGNKMNNDLNNLEWLTGKENIQHAFEIGLRNSTGEKNNSAKLTEKEVLQIVNSLMKQDRTQKQLAKDFKVSLSVIERIKGKQTWRHLTKDIVFPKVGLQEEEVKEIIDHLLHVRYTIEELGKMYGVNKNTISRIRAKRSWKYLTEGIEFTKRSTTSRKA